MGNFPNQQKQVMDFKHSSLGTCSRIYIWFILAKSHLSH